MQAFKDFLRNNVKLVAAVLIVLLGLAGVKLAPETANSVVQSVADAIAPAPTTPAQ